MVQQRAIAQKQQGGSRAEGGGLKHPGSDESNNNLADLQLRYQNFKNTLHQLASKIGDVEQEAEEHKLVLDTLAPLSGDRKCFRMINGVLIERTVKDVIPALRTNSQGLKQVLDELLVQYKTKQDEMEKWKKTNKIQVVQQ